MHYFFVEQDAVTPPVVTMTAEQSHHIANVLRLNVGDSIAVCDNTGNVYRALLLSVTVPASARIIESVHIQPPETQIVLFQALLKAGKMETVVKATTELGVDEIQPFLATRSVARPKPSNSRHKESRLSKIARAAAEQSGRTFLPVVNETLPWKQIPPRLADFPIVLAAWEREKTTMLSDKVSDSRPLDRVALIVGPEGGFTESEVADLLGIGAVTVCIAPFTLRAETAAIAAVSLVRHLSTPARTVAFS